jgi:glycosyltransferase involved in cell wall biosynthesis
MKFSIITVVLNDVKNIEKTILSVKKQSYKNFEHIIVDGNSSDGTTELIKKYSKFLIHFKKKDKSLYEAINRGIKKSRGEIIFLIHSGDIFADKDILKKVDKLFKKKFDVISGNIQFYDETKKTIVRNWALNIDNLNNQNFFKVPHTSLFIKKKFLNRIRNYSSKYKISSDLDFLIKLSKIKKNFYYFNKNIVFMKTGGLSTSINSFFIKFKEDIKILYKHFGLFFLLIYPVKVLFKIPGLLQFDKNENNRKLKKELNYLNEK